MIRAHLFEFFNELRDPAARSNPAMVQAHFASYLDLWTRAESRGFDGIFFSEHHFGAAYSPSPNLIVAAMAGRTKTMRLGVLGSVTPYATPWKVVEEFAMLDQLTGGRFEPGIVSGIPPELMAVNIDLRDAAEIHEEIADVIDKALALGNRGGAITHQGTHWQFCDLRLIPPFVQESPRLWTAAKSNTSGARAGRHGWNLCGGFLSTRDLGVMFDHYRSAASDSQHRHGPEHLAIRRHITFTDASGDQASGIREGKKALLELLTESIGPLPPFAAVLDRPEADSSGLSDDEFVSGTPNEVAEQLIEQCRATGAGRAVVMFAPVDHAALDHAHDQFATHVIPALHAASVR